ncbi:MAG: hypothetical protein DME19_14805 [Verrucomicrobia bacterium]|nr:MAG: hypothetical protein DME19_14805 [Verrucomicrobiota bacterium]
MNETSESIQKKTRHLPSAVLIWLASFILVVFAAMMVVGSVPSVRQEPPHPLSVFIAGIIGASVLLCLWLFVRWSSCCWRNLRRSSMGLAVLATSIAIFYTGENWRGKRAWENCKRALEAKGTVLDWNAYIPPPVPDEQNIFNAPKMQEWFVGSSSELSQRLNTGPHGWEAAGESRNASPVIVAELTVVPAKASLDSGKTELTLRFDDPGARAQAKKLINDAVGPAAIGAQDYTFFTRPLNQIKPVHILLVADKVPTIKEVAELFPSDTIAPPSLWYRWYSNRLQVESVGTNSFRVALNLEEVQTATDYLARSDRFETDFDLIRQALKRPYARMEGDYQEQFTMPIPNFVCIRTLAQTLAQRAQCHLLLGQPEKALRELTLFHDVSRLLEARPTGKPMSLVAAMINAAITGLYVDTVADGMRLQAWHEPQLIALEEQLQDIHLPRYAVEAMQDETAGVCRALETTGIQAFRSFGKTNLWQKIKNPEFLLSIAMPRGWFYQNMAIVALQRQKALSGFDRAREIVLPGELDKVSLEAKTVFNDFSPYTFLAARAVPNWTRAWQTLARNQTMANEAFLVCALERYRIAHGQYPETLDVLAPRYVEKIPQDIIGGGPLKYRRTDDGQFALYSIGWNERDDGGQAVLNKDGRPNSEQGDWVWRYPTAQ